MGMEKKEQKINSQIIQEFLSHGKECVFILSMVRIQCRSNKRSAFWNFCFTDYDKASDYVDHSKLWKILRDENTRPPYLPPEKPVGRSRSISYNWTCNNKLVPNWERSTSRLYIVTLLI